MRYATQGQKDALIAALLTGKLNRMAVDSDAIQRAIYRDKIFASLVGQMINTEFGDGRILLDLDKPCYIFNQHKPAPPKQQIESRVRGCVSIDPKKIVLRLSRETAAEGPGPVSGSEIYRRQHSMRVLPPSVAVYFFNNPEKIPESWWGKTIYCWGRLASSLSGKRLVVGINCRDSITVLEIKDVSEDFEPNTDCSMTLPD